MFYFACYDYFDFLLLTTMVNYAEYGQLILMGCIQFYVSTGKTRPLKQCRCKFRWIVYSLSIVPCYTQENQ